MAQIYVIGQDDVAAVEIADNSITKDDNLSENTSNIERSSTPDSIEEINSSVTENCESTSNPDTEVEDELQTDLELEKSQNEWKAKLRVESFKAILWGSPIQLSWLEFILQITGTIFLVFYLPLLSH